MSTSDLNERRQAINYFRGIGATIPTALEDAFQALDAVLRTRVTTEPVPDAYAIDVDNAQKVTTDYVAALSRRAASEDGVAAIRGAVGARLINECGEARDSILADPKVRAEFDAGSAVYSEHYATVAGLTTAAEAMDADGTGDALVAFRAVSAATQRLDKLVNALLDLTAPVPHGVLRTRSKLSAAMTLGLTADPPADSAAYLAALDAANVRGGVPDRHSPYGIYGAQIDAGAVPGLPTDTTEWRRRADAFDVDAARVELYLPAFARIG